MRIGHGRDRDRSARRGHADGFYHDGGHLWAVPMGGEVHHGPFSKGPDCFAFPKPSSEELKANADKTLQDLFASYTSQLREALHRVFTSEAEVPKPSRLQEKTFQEARDNWLRNAEAYIKATSVAAHRLGLAAKQRAKAWLAPSVLGVSQASGSRDIGIDSPAKATEGEAFLPNASSPCQKKVGWDFGLLTTPDSNHAEKTNSAKEHFSLAITGSPILMGRLEGSMSPRGRHGPPWPCQR